MQGNAGGGQGAPASAPEKHGDAENQAKYMPQPGQGAYPSAAHPAAMPVQIAGRNAATSPWHYSLCYCCQDMDSCMEACCCFFCQASRQCNFLTNNEKEIHWPLCFGMLLMELFLTDLVSCIVAMEVRRLTRSRYGIHGNVSEDCCVAWCCRSCSTQQILLEMTAMNDFPGASCYDAPSQPTSYQMT